MKYKYLTNKIRYKIINEHLGVWFKNRRLDIHYIYGTDTGQKYVLRIKFVEIK